MFLTHEELQRLTGYRTPARQARWLEEHGFRFERDRAGRVVVLRAHVAAMMCGVEGARPEPDFSEVFRG